MRPSDSRRSVAARAGSLRFLGFSFPARCLQSPRGACRLRSSVASPAVAGVAISGRLAAPKKCNEAESSSLALRLTGSPPRASPWGLLLSVPDWLHVGHSFDMLITFQINREARLGLTHPRAQRECPNRQLIGSSHLQFRHDPPLSFTPWIPPWPRRSESASRIPPRAPNPVQLLRGCRRASRARERPSAWMMCIAFSFRFLPGAGGEGEVGMDARSESRGELEMLQSDNQSY